MLRWLCPEDAERFVTQLVFMLASGNGDAHLKNWSILYPDRRTPRLAPAYDLVSTVVYRPSDDLALTLGGTKDLSAITPASFDGIARCLQRDTHEVQRWVRAAWDRTLQVWSEQGAHLSFTPREHERLSAHLARMQLGP